MARQRGNSLLFAASVFTIFAIGCARSPFEARLRTSAPTSAQDTGIVVKLNASNSEAQLSDILETNESAQYRVINKKLGLVEIFNVSEAEIHNAVDSVETTPNVFVKNLIPRAHTNAVDIETCTKSSRPPVAVIEPQTHATKVKNGLIDMKDGAVLFSGAKSKKTNPDAKTVELLWVIYAPPGSNLDGLQYEGDSFVLKPDMPGAYSVNLVAQDDLSACNLDSLDVGVTLNEPYLGTSTPRPFDTTKDSTMFHHLGEIRATAAWTLAKGEGVKIAVLDTGVNYNHPDLRANILTNSKEVAGNGIDDDNNGQVDDTVGWDFFANDNMPLDDNMHGTHVAGLAASAVTGIAPKAKILPVKVMGPLGSGDFASIVGGIYYAADRGVDFINMSLGVDGFALSQEERASISKLFKDAADYARKSGTVLVSAAGNGDQLTGVGFDIDKSPVYPASVAAPNMVAVSAVDSYGTLTSYSNFGVNTVAVAAPGGTSKKPLAGAYYVHTKRAYVGLAGTSMATPVAVGALALIKSSVAGMKSEQAVRLLSATGTLKAQLNGKVKSGAEIDVMSAVQKAKTPSLMDMILAFAGL